MSQFVTSAVILFALNFSLAVGQQFQILEADTLASDTIFESQLLKHKVPETFRRHSLQLVVFSDSSWQVQRADSVLTLKEVLTVFNRPQRFREYEEKLREIEELNRHSRINRVIGMGSGAVGLFYLSLTSQKSWLYMIPGFVAVGHGVIRWWESRVTEIEAQRAEYMMRHLIPPHMIKQWVDDYNFSLYQKLSTAGIQFHEQ